MPDVNALVLPAGSPHLGKTCPFCSYRFMPEEQVVVCPVDSTVIHRECWQANDNKCTTFGCSGRGVVVVPVVSAAIEWQDTPSPLAFPAAPTVKSAPVYSGPPSAPNRTTPITLLAIGALIAVIALVLLYIAQSRPQAIMVITVVAPTARRGNEMAAADAGATTESIAQATEDGSARPTARPTTRPAATPTRRPTSTARPRATVRSAAAAGPRDELVFESNRDGDYEIYIAALDGSNVRHLTDNDADDEFPRVSPDGRQIVFVSQRDGNSEIYVVSRDGSQQTRLTFDPAEDRLPTWSPNGRQIAFQSGRFGIPDIFVMERDGSGLRQVTDSPEREGHTSWSKDGKLVYNASLELFWQIYVCDLDGGNRRRLTNSRIDEWSPEWSPDGKRILFLSERNSSINPGIYVMDANGENVQLVYDSEASEWGAVWSADGQSIFFAADQPDGTASIYVISASGARARKIIDRGGYPSVAPAVR